MTATKLKGMTEAEEQAARAKQRDRNLFTDDNSPADYLEAVPEPASYQLRYPLKWKDTEYRTLTLRPITGRDFSTFQVALSQGIDANTAALVILTDTPLAVIRRLQAVDMIKLSELAQSFFPQAGAPVSGSGLN